MHAAELVAHAAGVLQVAKLLEKTRCLQSKAARLLKLPLQDVDSGDILQHLCLPLPVADFLAQVQRGLGRLQGKVQIVLLDVHLQQCVAQGRRLPPLLAGLLEPLEPLLGHRQRPSLVALLEGHLDEGVQGEMLALHEARLPEDALGLLGQVGRLLELAVLHVHHRHPVELEGLLLPAPQLAEEGHRRLCRLHGVLDRAAGEVRAGQHVEPLGPALHVPRLLEEQKRCVGHAHCFQGHLLRGAYPGHR
mmetsp:Transcript_67199/g.199820  ORF Transcript_67199/g.199820 Transcript_67199/m.199820 type:complete len:248 (-) Transcript_67199:21-764(-)